MIFLLKLLLAHLIGDFAFQPKSWILDKQKRKHRSPKLYLHIAIHALLLITFLGFDFSYWPALLTIILSHLIIDILKLHAYGFYNARWLFFIDQGLHIGILTGVSLIYYPDLFSEINISTESLLLWGTAIALLTFVAAIVIRIAVSGWSPHTEDDKDDSLALAGRYIGMLERLFVFGFVIFNHWEGIGFLLAAKSVFRFGDLTASKDRKLTEYILIGTLLSFGIAILTGLLFLKIQKLI